MKESMIADLQDLSMKVFKVTKIAREFFITEKSPGRLTLESAPLAIKSPIEKLMFKEIKFSSFGSMWELPTYAGEGYGCQLHLIYSHKTGGSNGIETGVFVSYTEANGWEVTVRN